MQSAHAEAAQSFYPAKRVRRSAPQVVKEYVALNGFSPEEPFTVQRDMTLWSIAKLYWPSYRGATLEQLNAAFAARNPDAFEKGDVSRLIRGAVLQPPSLEAVLAEDPAEAFRAVYLDPWLAMCPANLSSVRMLVYCDLA